MTISPFDEPSRDEQFYARALHVLSGPTRRWAIFSRLSNVAYWISVTGALGWLLAQALDRRPPIVVHEATLLTPKVDAGDPIRVSYTITRLKTCETDVSWSVYDGVQEIHRFGPIHVAAPGLPGDDDFVHAWPTPPDAAPGHAKLRVMLAFSCPDNYLQALYPVALVLPDLAVDIGPRR